MSAEERDSLLEYLNERGREVLYSCIHNCVYNDKVPVEKRKEIRHKLKDKGKILEFMADSTKTDKRKRPLLKQTGEGLPLILSAILPLLSRVLE